ncbi:hypothetical protein [Halioxenophilus sp. WMMB6]|uniref:hypothetical protein n=1 Tax=Halioxenophilus sp. WMMB6 TaxID=3073815 RepID=UPI00295E824A|nr:hypothetical protein [Halioxenophilus sp. WMMB6]
MSYLNFGRQRLLVVLGTMLLLAGCETGHLLSLYSLGFQKRDVYLDNLADARDAMRYCVARLAPAVAADSEVKKAIKRCDESTAEFASKLKTSNRVAKDWLGDWHKHPEEFQSGKASVVEVETEQRLLLQQGRQLAESLNDGRKNLDRGVAIAPGWLAEAEAWLAAANQHIIWLESSNSGYPVPKSANP